MGKDQELLQAIRNNDVSAVKKLLSKFKAKSKKGHKKHNLHIVDSDGFTPLHHAALGGNGEIVMALLDIVHDVNIKDKKGMTPLHLAAWAGQVEPALLLLDAGAQTNLCSRNGSTPLHLASEHGNYVVVERLVDHDCDPTVVTNQGETALDLACRFGHLEVVRILLYNTKGKCDRLLNPKEFQEKDSPLHMAAKTGHCFVVKILVEAGADVNQKGPTGSCLHEAALYGKTDVVKYLIEAGIDVNIKNREGLTALDVVSKFTKAGVSSEIKHLLREASLEVVYAKAIRDYCNIKDPSFLTLHLGDIVLVLERHKDGMWKGCIRDDQKERIGFFPASAVKVLRSPSTRNSVRTSTASNDGPKVTSIAPVTTTFEIVTVASPAQPIAGKSRAPRMSSFRKKASTRSESGERRPVPSENGTESLLRRPQSSDLDDRNKRKLNYLDIMLVDKAADHSDGGHSGPMSAPPTKTEYADIWMPQTPAKDAADGAPRDRLTNGHARDVAKQQQHDEHVAQLISQQRQQQIQKQVKFQQHLQQQLQTQLHNQQANSRSPLKPVASCPPLPIKARHNTISAMRSSTSDEVPPLPLKKRQSFSGRATSPTSPEQPALPPKLEKKLRSSLRGDRRGTSPPPPPPPPPPVSSTPSPVPSHMSSVVSETSPRTSNPSPPITIANSNRLTVEAKWCPVLTPSPPPTAPQPIVQSSSSPGDYPTPPSSVSSSSLPSTPKSSPVHGSGNVANSLPAAPSPHSSHPPGSPPSGSHTPADPLHPGSPSPPPSAPLPPPSSPRPPPSPPPPPPTTPPPPPSPPPNTFPSPCRLPPPLMFPPSKVLPHPHSPPASPPPPPPISPPPPMSAFKTPPSSPPTSPPPPIMPVAPSPATPSPPSASPLPIGTPTLQFVVTSPEKQCSETVPDYAIHRPVINSEKCPVSSNPQGAAPGESKPELIQVLDTRLRAPTDVISRVGYEDMDRLKRTWTNPMDRPRIPDNSPGYVVVNPVAKPASKEMQSSGNESNAYENFVPLKVSQDQYSQRSPAEQESPAPSVDKPDKPDRHRYVNCDVTKETTQSDRTTVIPVPATLAKTSRDTKNREYNEMYDWLAQSKLLTYFDNFAEAGFDMTAVVGLTPEDLSDIQITKTGHRKRLLSEACKLPMPNLSSQSDVPSWLASLNLSQYKNHFIDGGFDDIEFLYDLTREDLLAIGITKIGHQRKILMAAKRLQQRDVPDGVTSPDEKEDSCFDDVMASPGDELLGSATAEQNVGDTAVAGVSDYTEIKACNTELGACTTSASNDNVVEYSTQDNTTDAAELVIQTTDELTLTCANKASMNGVVSEDSPDGVKELAASFQHTIALETKKAKPPPVKPKSYKKPPPTVAPKPKPKRDVAAPDVNATVDFTSVIKEAEAISSQDSGSEASPPGTLARQHHAGSMGSLEGSLHTNTSGSQGSLNSESEDFQREIKESFVVKKEPVPSSAPKSTLKPELADHLTLSQEDLLEMQRREEELKNMQSENDKSDSLFTDIQGMLDNLNSEIDDMFK